MTEWYENWDWSRYNIGAGANVTQGFKHADWLKIRQEGEALMWRQNALLQQMLYAPILQTISEVSNDISLTVTWNPAVLPKITSAHHIYWDTSNFYWDRDGRLDVSNISVLDANSSPVPYRSYTYGLRPDVPVGSDDMIVPSTPLRPGKYYFEIEIIEDTYYDFSLAPLGWIGEDSNESLGNVATIASYGRGVFSGLKAGSALLYDSYTPTVFFYGFANTVPEHSNVPFPNSTDGNGDTVFEYNRPLIAGDILQFAYDSNNNRAFIGMNGIYARWNAASTYTQMDPTDLNTGIVVDMKNQSYGIIATPYEFLDLSDPNYVTNTIANANVRILTGDACNYSPPVGYTDH
jgi:hypothetical protein